ncbi:unnamed protein product [Rotaria sordida]|uniref:Uncharacterized protein n=1 Tax=Rotaria sordida TaxID=392033 RepID=A0A815TAZ8_9BILA|nr:unnamed protein product [Rotaria sordida]CAF1505727.1 unnamed protein product [Rotaria sordida]
MLKTCNGAKVIVLDKFPSDPEQENRVLLKPLNKRLVRRQIICPKPYHVWISANQCVWSCGEGTQPDTTTNERVCENGYYEIGTDEFGRRICAKCLEPYHVVTSDKRCVWSCGEGTEPDNTTNECVCQKGYYETGTDGFGRRICSPL